GQTDSVVQSIIPGGIDGNVFSVFGIPLDGRGSSRRSECDDRFASAEAALANAQADRTEKFNAMRQAAGEASEAIRAFVAADNILLATEREHAKDRDALFNAGFENSEAQAIIRKRIDQIGALTRTY